MGIGAKIAHRAAGALGLRVVSKKRDLLHYQHDYGAGGYAEYRKVQVHHNKRKLDRVWADDRTLETIADYVRVANQAEVRGLCHGARNGWEVQKFKKLLACEVIGTDISETANDMPDMVEWDFHESRDDWKGGFSFIYTNSLDQAFDPAKALDAWAEQLTQDGLIFIEHTMFHAPAGASEMDPFGAHPMIMPYLFFEWGRGKYEMADILKLHDVAVANSGPLTTKGDVWIFVLRRPPSGP